MPDILKAILTLSAAFRKAGLEVPEAIVLKDADEGSRLLWQLHEPSLMVLQYLEEDLMMSTVKVMGIEIRWPSKKFIMADGEVRYA